MQILMQYPWAALIVAACLFAVWRWRRRTATAIAACAWASYAVYEYLMLTRVLCSGDCNIRIDLLLVYPVLLLMTVIAAVQTLRPPRGDNRRAA